MNFKMVLKSLGIVLLCEAVFMLPSLAAALYYKGSDETAFAATILLLAVLGVPMYLQKPASRDIYARDGFAIVGFGWVLISFFGALPFVFSGSIPSLIDSLFESISGFTTTGASILTNVEVLPKGILFWRSFTHWIGGMGVLVLTLAILPSVGARTFHIMKAESPGPSPGKLVPKIGQTAKILYSIYFVISVIEVILLKMAGMSWYDALIHTFGTAGTGGFSNMNASVGAFKSVAVDVIITVFMLIFGVNFSLYFYIFRGNLKSVLKDEEFRFYFGIVLASILLIAVNIHGRLFESVGDALRYSSFQVASIITTTGYATADFNLWPVFSQAILVMLMLVGSCAGSTGGGMKVIRILLLLKVIRREIIKIIHPRSVHAVRIGGRAVEEETLSGVMVFFFTYVFILVMAVLVVSIDCKDIVTSVTAVIATIGNIGPGLGMVGPMGNYAEMSDISKLILSFCMIVGRLEIFPVLLLFAPSFWKRVNI